MLIHSSINEQRNQYSESSWIVFTYKLYSMQRMSKICSFVLPATTHLLSWGCKEKSIDPRNHQSWILEWSYQPLLRARAFHNPQFPKSCDSIHVLPCRWIFRQRNLRQMCIGWVLGPEYPFLPEWQTRVGCARSTNLKKDSFGGCKEIHQEWERIREQKRTRLSQNIFWNLHRLQNIRVLQCHRPPGRLPH